jgi:hypothetical protein
MATLEEKLTAIEEKEKALKEKSSHKSTARQGVERRA